MGLRVKRSKKNKYQLSSSISDESYHPDKQWLTQDEAKKLLIDMDFPSKYVVNGKIQTPTGTTP